MIRDLLPIKLRKALGVLNVVLQRSHLWFKILVSLKGKTNNDRKVLRKAIIESPWDIFSQFDTWKFPIVKGDCEVLAKGVGKFYVRAFSDDLFHVLPRQEPMVEAAIRDILKPGDNFVDAGANVGFYTILGSKLVGEKGKVLSFEMVPETAKILRSHVDLNSLCNCVVVEGALAEVSGLSIKASLIDGKSGQSSIKSDHCGKEISVKSVKLADYLDCFPFIKLMKIDVEGAEFEALLGADEKLHKINSIIFENRGADSVVKFLGERDYVIRDLDQNNSIAQKLVRKN